MESNIETKIVTAIAVLIAIPFVINIFYYGLSDGTWFTFSVYERLFEMMGNSVLHLLDSLFAE